MLLLRFQAPNEDVDRIMAAVKVLAERFAGQGNGLRSLWEQTRPME